MARGMHFSPIAVLLFIFVFAVFCFSIGAVLQYPDEDASSVQNKRSRWPRIGIALAGGSQLLYLVFSLVGLFRWIRFYPGNPVEVAAILAGASLCVVGFVIALFGEGLGRWAGALSCAATTILWLLTAIASVAV